MKQIKIADYKNHKISDSDVVKRILAGEKELYEILLRRNNQKLYRVIRSYVKEQDVIEDIMQNTYLRAYEKLEQYKHHSQFSTWLIRIGINQSLAKIKVNAKTLNLYSNTDESIEEKLNQLEDKNQLSPEKIIIRQESKQMLENAIQKLDQKYRTIYILKEIEGMSINEIAECMDLTDSNVKVRLHRAKSMIKKRLYTSSLSKDIFEYGFSRCDSMVEKVMNKI